MNCEFFAVYSPKRTVSTDSATFLMGDSSEGSVGWGERRNEAKQHQQNPVAGQQASSHELHSDSFACYSPQHKIDDLLSTDKNHSVSSGSSHHLFALIEDEDKEASRTKQQKLLRQQKILSHIRLTNSFASDISHQMEQQKDGHVSTMLSTDKSATISVCSSTISYSSTKEEDEVHTDNEAQATQGSSGSRSRSPALRVSSGLIWIEFGGIIILVAAA